MKNKCKTYLSSKKKIRKCLVQKKSLFLRIVFLDKSGVQSILMMTLWFKKNNLKVLR